MKKYICSNCGFRSRLQTENVLTETGVKRHRCKNCGCIVFTSKKVLESMMRLDMVKNHMDFKE